MGMGVRFPAPVRLARLPKVGAGCAVPRPPRADRLGAAASMTLNRGERAGGAHVTRRHVRFGEAGCAASAAACWAKGRDAAAPQHGAGWVLGSWRESGRTLRGSVG